MEGALFLAAPIVLYAKQNIFNKGIAVSPSQVSYMISSASVVPHTLTVALLVGDRLAAPKKDPSPAR